MDKLAQTLQVYFSEAEGCRIEQSADGVTLQAPAEGLAKTFLMLRDTFNFSQLIDIAGIDYSLYTGQHSGGSRYAAVYHLLSLADNRRLRLRAFCPEDDFPRLPSATSVWPAADWYEREAFDLFGIVFDGHEDLRRLLTDYGFIGHPFRKDFPLSGHVEMRYDPQQKRVIYQPVSIDPREVTPRIVREDTYGKQ